MRHYLLFFLLLTFVLIPTACKRSSDQLPMASGDLGSLVVVLEPELQPILKQQLEASFLKPVPHLPTAEPFFDLKLSKVDDFYKHFSTHRTILVLLTQSHLDAYEDLTQSFKPEELQASMNKAQASLLSARNIYAQHQHIVYLIGKDAADLQRKLVEARSQLVSSLMQYELQDQHDELFSDTQVSLSNYQMIQKELGIGVKIPKAFSLKYQDNKTYWFEFNAMSSNTPKTIGLVVHAYPYTNLNALSYESIRTVRDTVMKHLIKGELPGTYMGTSSSLQYPSTIIETIQLHGRMCKKVRGWWTIRGLSQAGPFVRYVVLDEPKQQLFVFEGFVYKPNIETKERDLRLIESIALSIE